jgi:RNA-binding protein
MSEMTAGKKRRIKRRLCTESPTVWVGKSGVSEELIGETKKQLEKKGMIKAKILKSALIEAEAMQIAREVARETESVLVEVKGHTFMLYKSRKK